MVKASRSSRQVEDWDWFRTTARRTGTRWDQGPVEPEPSAYYYRVHQHVQQTQRASQAAMARRDPRRPADSPQRAQAPAVQDLRLRWRHHIYAANLWALDVDIPGNWLHLSSLQRSFSLLTIICPYIPGLLVCMRSFQQCWHLFCVLFRQHWNISGLL